MFTNNPFAELAASIPPSAIQTYVVLIVILVVAGTLLDVLHKKRQVLLRELAEVD